MTPASGCSFLAFINSSSGNMCAIGHSASKSGMTIFLSGFKMYAVSAIKSTPQNTTKSLSSISDALIHNSNESPKKSAIS